MHKFEVKNALKRHSLCNDGSPAIYYYRNCTANIDSHGTTIDYCKKGDPQGVETIKWFIYISNGDGVYCFDNKTCSTRSKNLTSSLEYPEKINPNGILSVTPE